MDHGEMNAQQMLQFQAKAWKRLASEQQRKQQTFDEWLLENGEVCGPVIILPEEQLGPIKQCYENSFKAIVFGDYDTTEWFYTEGVVLRGNMPLLINHAWLTNRKGEVIDLTLRDPENCTYYGIPFDPDFMIEAVEEHGYYGVFTDGAMYNRNLVFKPLPEGARAWPRREELEQAA